MKSVSKVFTTLLFALVTIAAVSVTGYARQKPSNKQKPEFGFEERMIRTAYAKLMVFNKAARLRKAEDEGAAYQREHDLRFEIRNVRTGPISEIHNVLWGDMVTRRLGDVLDVVPGETRHNEGPKHIYYLVRWTDAGHRNPTSLSETVEDVLGSEPDFADVGKYTSYEVTVYFEGRQRSYRAMVVYHQPPQSVKQTKIEFLDHVVGSFALGEALSEQNPPMRFPWVKYRRSRAYLQTGSAPGSVDPLFDIGGDKERVQKASPVFPNESDIPIVGQQDEQGSDFKGIRWNFSNEGICPDMEFVGMCCDSATMDCCFPYDPINGICDEMTCGYPNCWAETGSGGGGGFNEGPSCRAATQYGQVIQKGFENTDRHVFVGHITRHTGWAKFQPKCDTAPDCTTTCSVLFHGSPPYGHHDDGPTTTVDRKFHVVQVKTADNSRGSMVRGAAVECSAAVAMGFKACTDRSCSFQVSLTLGPAGWQASSDGFYEGLLQHSFECRVPSR